MGSLGRLDVSECAKGLAPSETPVNFGLCDDSSQARSRSRDPGLTWSIREAEASRPLFLSAQDPA